MEKTSDIIRESYFWWICDGFKLEDKLGRAGNVILGKINEYLKFWIKTLFGGYGGGEKWINRS